MARYECERCGTVLNTTDTETHLCKDLKKRYERQKQAVNAVVKILDNYSNALGIEDDAQKECFEEIALEIIKAIGARDNGL